MKYPRKLFHLQSYKVTEDMKKEMLHLRKKGLTYKEIAVKIGITAPAVGYWVNPLRKKKSNEASMVYWLNNRDKSRERTKKFIQDKRKELPVEMRLYENPNAKFRKISNELFMNLIN